jgi:hypothetical protein
MIRFVEIVKEGLKNDEDNLRKVLNTFEKRFGDILKDKKT